MPRSQFEPRYVPTHRRILDKTVCGSSGSRVQDQVQSAFQILGFRPLEFKAFEIMFGSHLFRVLEDLKTVVCQ